MKGIEANENLRVFYLRGDDISDVGATAIASLVKTKKNLDAFYLFGGNITDVGAEELSKAIQASTNLSTFYFYKSIDGDISNTGATAFATALQGAQNVTAFYLDGENISGEGLLALASAVNNHPSIKSMNIYGSKCTLTDIENAVAALKTDVSGLKICIGSDELSEEDCKNTMEEYEEDFEEFRIMVSRQHFYDYFKTTEILKLNWL